MQSSELGEKEKGRLEGDLTDTKHELLKVRDMLDMAEKVRRHFYLQLFFFSNTIFLRFMRTLGCLIRCIPVSFGKTHNCFTM